MLEILSACWDLFAGLLASIWGVLSLLLIWAWEVLYHLHMSAPRLEGLLIGVLLTWLLMRRDRHPVIRVLSAPLKLVIDVLDLAWDQLVEVLVDVKDAVVGGLSKAWGFLSGRVSSLYGKIVSGLQGLKNKLSK